MTDPHQGQQGQHLLRPAPPEGFDRLEGQRQGVEAGTAGHGAAHVADHQVGGMEPQGSLGGQQAGDGAQVAAGAEHLQHPVALGGQPAVDPAAGGNSPLQQGPIEVGDQHQLSLSGQGRSEMALEPGPWRPPALLRPRPPDRAWTGSSARGPWLGRV